jgi:hypothetical protein
MAWARDRNHGPPLERTLRLLLNGYTEDVHQLMVHLTNPIGGVHGQSIQECCSHDHILAGPCKGWMRHTFVVDGVSDGYGSSSGFGEVNGGGSLCP